MAAALFGKIRDPNIRCLLPLFDLFIDQEAALEWDLDEDVLLHNREVVSFTSYFGRADVFGDSTDLMKANYFLLRNFLLAHPEISRHNKAYERETPLKAANLYWARKHGFTIPRTTVGVCLEGFEVSNAVVKPLTGGHYVVEGVRARYPAIIQQKVRGSNRRLFLVGEQHFGFEIASDALDYRTDPSVKIKICPFPEDVVRSALGYSRYLGLTFAALDFIDNVFLEINTMPMFSAFDLLTDGQLSKAVRDSL